MAVVLQGRVCMVGVFGLALLPYWLAVAPAGVCVRERERERERERDREREREREKEREERESERESERAREEGRERARERKRERKREYFISLPLLARYRPQQVRG
jgi:flagellar biosynthesis/type III secretory pathway M-ring protein FliF/YscJ